MLLSYQSGGEEQNPCLHDAFGDHGAKVAWDQYLNRVLETLKENSSHILFLFLST